MAFSLCRYVSTNHNPTGCVYDTNVLWNNPNGSRAWMSSNPNIWKPCKQESAVTGEKVGYQGEEGEQILVLVPSLSEGECSVISEVLLFYCRPTAVVQGAAQCLLTLVWNQRLVCCRHNSIQITHTHVHALTQTPSPHLKQEVPEFWERQLGFASETADAELLFTAASVSIQVKSSSTLNEAALTLTPPLFSFYMALLPSSGSNNKIKKNWKLQTIS